MATTILVSPRLSEKVSLTKVLLISGIFSSLLYVAINIIVPMQYKGYNVVSQTVSELSAIGAPTRQLWVKLCMIYILLYAAFGWGVLRSAGRNRPLRVVGVLIIIYSIVNLYWPPMHPREVIAAGGGTLTDTLHIVWASLAILLMMVMMGFGAAAFGKQFRIYTIVTMMLHIVFGFLTGIESPNIAANLPTPMIGVWERINIGVYMLWIIVLALMLLRKKNLYDSITQNKQFNNR